MKTNRERIKHYTHILMDKRLSKSAKCICLYIYNYNQGEHVTITSRELSTRINISLETVLLCIKKLREYNYIKTFYYKDEILFLSIPQTGTPGEVPLDVPDTIQRNIVSSEQEKRMCDYLHEIIPKEYTIYDYTNNQHQIKILESKSTTSIKLIYPDFYCKELNLIVEFFGDYWHCNTNMFPDLFEKIPNRGGMCASDIISINNEKQRILEEMGYNYFVVWEEDWIHNNSWIKEKLKETVDNILKENENILLQS